MSKSEEFKKAVKLSEYVVKDKLLSLHRADSSNSDSNYLVLELRIKETQEVKQELETSQKKLNGLSHRGILPRVGYFYKRKQLFLVHSHDPGVNLEKRLLDTEQKMSPEAAVEFALQLTDTLAYLHEQKPPILMNCLDPALVMITKRGNVKLLHSALSGIDYKTMRSYEAPEKKKKAEPDVRTDLFGIGAILHQVLSKAELSGTLEPIQEHLPDLDKDLANIVSRCTVPDPKRRYPSAFQLRTRLSRLIDKWKLARRDGRAALAEWAGFEPTQPKEVTSKRDIVDLTPPKEPSVEEFVAAARPREAVPIYPAWFKVLVASILLIGGLLLTNGFDIVDGLYWFLVVGLGTAFYWLA